MAWQTMICLILAMLIGACTQQQAEQGLKAASDIHLIEECAQFQAAKNVLHDRLADLSTPALERLRQINHDGRILCTAEIVDYTIELREMAEDLP